MKRRVIILVSACLVFSIRAADADFVKSSLKDLEVQGNWIYNDLSAGFAEAQKSGKPLLLVFRCVPCVACKTIDGQVARRDPIIADMLDRFICVRVVQTNGIDLTLFQYDYDLSWAILFLNADKTIYARYGTRSDRKEMDRDVSIEGFRKTMEGVLDLHKSYPANKALFSGKVGSAPKFASPEQYPKLAAKYKSALPETGDSKNVRQACIHCHMVGEAQREVAWKENRRSADDLYQYPMPNTFGVQMDPLQKSTVKSVATGSAGEKAGFKSGDEVMTMEGQAIASTADMQWVLHHLPGAAEVRSQVKRAGKTVDVNVKLADGWKRNGEFTWRTSTWEIRRMAGGMLCDTATPEERNAASVAHGAMAFKVKHVGQYSPHNIAQKAGLIKDDVIVKFDGRADNWNESQLLGYVVQQKKSGDNIEVEILRGGKKQTLKWVLP